MSGCTWTIVVYSSCSPGYSWSPSTYSWSKLRNNGR